MAGKKMDTASCIWHPFVETKLAHFPCFVKGEGSYLYTKEASYLDAISSWWVNLHGHAHPYIAQKIAKQATTLEHTIFTDFTHLPAEHYSKRLLAALPKGFSKVFYSDNGSTAIEVAVKMAILFWHHKRKKKKTILTLKGGFHGDTFGAMALAGNGMFNQPFHPFLFKVEEITPPQPHKEDSSIEEMRQKLQNEDVIAFVYEPLIQGASWYAHPFTKGYGGSFNNRARKKSSSHRR